VWTEPTVRRPGRVTGSPRERPLGSSTSGAIRHTGAVHTRRGKFGLTVEVRPPSTACGRETAASRSRAAGPTTGDTNTSGRHPSRGRRVRTYTRSVAGYPADRGVRLAVEADGGQKTARTGDSPGRSDIVSRRRPAIPLAERNRRLRGVGCREGRDVGYRVRTEDTEPSRGRRGRIHRRGRTGTADTPPSPSGGLPPWLPGPWARTARLWP